MNVSMPIAAVMLDLGFSSAAVKAVPILARTAGLLAHLAEEQEHPLGFLHGRRGGGGGRVRAPDLLDARARGRDPAVGGAARRRRRELPRPARLPLRPLGLLSREADGCRVRLRRGGGRARGDRAAAADREARAQGDVHARQPDRRASLRDAVRDRPDLLDERHHRRAELRPAHGRRPRQLGDRLGAQLRSLGRRRRPAHRLHLQRRAVRGRARRSPRSSASASVTFRSAPGTPSD